MTAFRTAHSPAEIGPAAPVRGRDIAPSAGSDISVEIHTRLETVEHDWRRFQETAECTAFQSFEWLAAWHRHIGRHDGIVPAIALGRFTDGTVAIIIPLAGEPQRMVRRLRFLGQDLCDYNAPLLARDFARRVTPERFVALWREVERHLQADSALRYDRIDFEKMPQTIGVQTNPFGHLKVTPNANSAHLAQLGDDWETYYRARRSSATRRRDRTKRKRMVAYGAVTFETLGDAADLRRTLDILWEQKKRIFAHKGIADIFARPGYREFFVDFACNPETRHLAHVSRLQVGETCAATNFAIVFGDCYYHVLSSYCEGALTRYGPGTLHLRELLAYAIARGLRLFDFTIGDEHYKLEWSDLRLRLFDYGAAATWRGWPGSLFVNARRRAKRFIKQTPLLWHAVSRLRSAVGPLLRPAPTEPPSADQQPGD